MNFDHTNKWYIHNPESVLESETHKLLNDFEIQTDHLISVRRPCQNIVKKKKKRTSQIVDLTVPADYRIKLKESEKRDKYLDLARELKKKLWNMKVTVIPILLVQGQEELKIRGWVETFQTTAFLRILRRVLVTWEDLLSIRRERLSANAGVEKLSKESNDNMPGTRLRRGNLKRTTKSLLIEEQNNVKEPISSVQKLIRRERITSTKTVNYMVPQ